MAQKKADIRMLNGYVVLYMPKHPTAMKGGNWDGYVYEHIIVAEKFLGRQLLSDEVCHHLDGNRHNNREENILVLLRSQHTKLHAWINRLSKESVNECQKSIRCESCGKLLKSWQRRYCSVDCMRVEQRNDRPSSEELTRDMETMTWVAIGKKYGVSDNAVRKWARLYGIL